MKKIDFDISAGDVLRYAGHRGDNPPHSLYKKAEKTAAECRKHITPAYIAARFALTETDKGIHIENTDLFLQGQDIKKHLAGCAECYILCATAGMGADAFIRSSMAVDTVSGILADGAATAAVESLCDRIEADLRQQLKAEGRYLTWRYSPGYGDFPFTQQPDILSVLQAGRFTGVTCNESCIMTPSKSVTAVMGIADRKPPDSRPKCSLCPDRKNCNFSCR